MCAVATIQIIPIDRATRRALRQIPTSIANQVGFRLQADAFGLANVLVIVHAATQRTWRFKLTPDGSIEDADLARLCLEF